MQNLSIVSLQSPIKRSIAIHYNKAKFVVIFQKLIKCFCVKFIVTQIKRRVYGFEPESSIQIINSSDVIRFKIYIDPSFFSFIRDYRATVHDKSIQGYA
mmetsp:Transcript_30318/g.93789  ORF Transcript_30318/g.93789 Transcript_30318/m.93789 type:complete len:99 (-) Transcript_30318:393-689(-)